MKTKSNQMTYSRVLCARTRKDMRHRFSLLLRQVGKKLPGVSLNERRKVQLSNIGYVAGYYDAKMMNRVRNWLGARHPVFG